MPSTTTSQDALARLAAVIESRKAANDPSLIAGDGLGGTTMPEVILPYRSYEPIIEYLQKTD